MPEFRVKDVVIIDPSIIPNPGDFVAAKFLDEHEIMLRKYKQLSPINIEEFELIALNTDWARILISKKEKGKIIETIIVLNRELKIF